MRKISLFLFLGVATFFLASGVRALVSIDTGSLDESRVSTGIVYPAGKDFETLRSLIERNFSSNNSSEISYGKTCILSNTLCPNYRYTSLTEKAIKLILVKTYEGNEVFYETLFDSPLYNSYNSSVFTDQPTPGMTSIEEILTRIPKGQSIAPFTANIFQSSTISDSLLSASFGLDMDASSSSSDMIRSIRDTIDRLKREKCQISQSETFLHSSACYYKVSNAYLPSRESLFDEEIYLNGKTVTIESLSGDLIYEVIPYTGSQKISPFPYEAKVDEAFSGFIQEKLPDTQGSGNSLDGGFHNLMRTFRSNPTFSGFVALQEKYYENKDDFSPTLHSVIEEEIRYYEKVFDTFSPTYSLRYTDRTYSLSDAQKKLQDMKQENAPIYYSSLRDWQKPEPLPCEYMSSEPVHAQCQEILSDVRLVMNALKLISQTQGVYPERIDELRDGKVNMRSDVIDRFIKNFSYKKVPANQGETGYEISYIGTLGSIESSSGSIKKDYRALMSGATVTVPEIFATIPDDTAFLYIKNPVSLIEILNMDSDTTARITGTDVSTSIKKLIQTFFEMEDTSRLEENLKHEAVLVIDSLDFTSPDVVMILSESDRDALSPTAKARVVASQSGYIYIANSKTTLDRFKKFDTTRSMKNADDLHYVWWKKGKDVRDAFFFVGDRFFEKALTLEGYVGLFRKYHTYTKLWSLQELVWAYKDAFGNNPESFDTLTKSFIQGENISFTGFTLREDRVSHEKIGEVDAVQSLREAYPVIDTITNTELQSYRENIEGYRDIWRANLDPLGIILNRYGDGMEVDFFMTPIPDGGDDLREIRKFLENTTKDHLDFIENTRIRNGIVSFVMGFDPTRLQALARSDKNIAESITQTNRDILDGKNVLDYLGGEFAFTLGALDPDMFEGWNVEKLDANVLIQFQSEEKGKEFIDIIRTRLAQEFSDSPFTKFLAKPLIEDYAGKKIYYVENIPIPFIGNISFAYTFIDNFCVLGINRMSIRNAIDSMSTNEKSVLIDENSFHTGTFLATLINGKKTGKQVADLYRASPKAFVSGIRSEFGLLDTLIDPLTLYIIRYERDHRLGKADPISSFSYGFATFRGQGGDIYLSLSEEKIKAFTGEMGNTWKELRPKLPEGLFTASGYTLMSIDEKTLKDIYTTIFMSHMSTALASPESLLQNITFGVDIGNDEIGFQFRAFREKHLLGHVLPSLTQSNLYMLLGGGLLLLILGVGVYGIMRRKSSPVKPLTK